MPNVIYTKKARKSIKSLDIRVKDRVKDGIEKIPLEILKSCRVTQVYIGSESGIIGLSTRWSMIQLSLMQYCQEEKHIKDCRRWFYEQRYAAWSC